MYSCIQNFKAKDENSGAMHHDFVHHPVLEII